MTRMDGVKERVTVKVREKSNVRKVSAPKQTLTYILQSSLKFSQCAQMRNAMAVNRGSKSRL